MNDEQLDHLLTQATPIDDHVIAELRLEDAERELLDEIMSTSGTRIAGGAPPAPLASRRLRRWPVLLASAAALVALVAAIIVWPRGDDAGPAFAAQAIAVAEANPRLLVDRDDWSVVRADQFAADQGEMTFSDGTHRLDVHWRPAADYEEFLQDRAAGREPVNIEILGMSGSMFSSESDPIDLTTLFPPQGINFLEIDGNIGSVQAYRDLLDSLVAVDVNTWLSALPPSVVKEVQRREVVADMLRGIPLPEGYDTTRFNTATGVQDRYQLGADVAGDVACSWFAQLHLATKNGDPAAKQSAIEALQTARQWPILLEMDADGGGYPEVLWELADHARGVQPPEGVRPAVDADGTVDLSVIKASLGCDSGVYDSIEAAS